MENTIWGTIFALAAVLLVWLGIRRRKAAHRDYEDDLQRYTASTMMKVVQLDESILETWEERDNGSRELCRQTVYLPTYEYTVDGRLYQYRSRQSFSGKWALGRQVAGYYDPSNPSVITENKPRRPIFGGFAFFAGAAFMLFFAIGTFAGIVAIT